MIISFSVDARRTQKSLNNIKTQLPVMIRLSSRVVAEELLKNVVALAPRDIPDYPKMLGVYRVGGEDVYAVMPAPKYNKQRIGLKDAGSVVVYVVPRFSRRPGFDAAKILAEHNPWTIPTLPYLPKNRDAEVVFRRVGFNEVAKTEGRISKIPNDVLAELLDLGVRLETVRTMNAKRDIAFEVLRAEFGIYRARVAHWRPAFRRVSIEFPNAVNRMLDRVIRGQKLRYNSGTSVRPKDVERGIRFQRVILGEDRVK